MISSLLRLGLAFLLMLSLFLLVFLGLVFFFLFLLYDFFHLYFLHFLNHWFIVDSDGQKRKILVQFGRACKSRFFLLNGAAKLL